MAAVEDFALGGVHPSHIVQFYEPDEAVLVHNMGRFLLEGLRHGEMLVVAARGQRWADLCAYIVRSGINVQALIEENKIVHLDAQKTLDQLMVEGYPDSTRFETIIGGPIRQAFERGTGARAYGELVDLLWLRGQYTAAIRLEQLWHNLQSQLPFSLFCGYQIDLFEGDFDESLLDALLSAHSHLLPSGTNEELMNALSVALEEVALGDAERILQLGATFRTRSWAALPRTEAVILWLRKHMPEIAPEVFRRAKRYYLATLDSGEVAGAEAT